MLQENDTAAQLLAQLAKQVQNGYVAGKITRKTQSVNK